MKSNIYFYRFIAFLVDLLIVTMPSILIYFFYNNFGDSFSIYEILIAFYFFYTSISFIAVENTIGLKMLNLKIIDIKKGKLYKSRLIFRNIILNMHFLYFIWVQFPNAFYILIPAIIAPLSTPLIEKRMMIWDYLSGVYIERKLNNNL